MHPIDQAELSLNPAVPLVIAAVNAVLIFGVSLDLRVESFRRVLREPRAPLIGLIAQFVVLPAVAFGISRGIPGAPSVALGLILVAACPGGSGSNFLTGLARGDVATSVTMTSISTVACVIMTPAVFAFWASMNADTAALLESIELDGIKVLIMLVLVLVIPVGAGMLVRARRPGLADRIRTPLRRGSVVLFLLLIAAVLVANSKLLVEYGSPLLPVALTMGVALTLGWSLGRAARLSASERRAVTIEVGIQNVSIAVSTVLVFFPTLAGALLTCLFWGMLHAIVGFALALTWSRIPAEPAPGA